ncbi:hypothetical protein E4P40_19910, partial [Blastococcus sp. CT_GayMR20]|uniref:PA14 domain-containing protein n=1 Tax=Blastococcus sp. CT_GayMR20 TaxID=2559609 RepID=UPI00110453B5
DQEATFTATRALTAGTHTVRVEFYDAYQEAVAKVSWVGAPPPPNATAPVPVIETPVAGATWKVGDTLAFSGSASDPQDGALPASALTWEAILQHCPSACHAHPLQTFTGVASGSFPAVDHEFPAYIDLKLTATDSTGATASVTRRLDPRTVPITVNSAPQGLQLTFGSRTAATPFTTTMIEGGTSSVSAPSPMTLNGTSYNFTSWSDGGGQSHNIVAGATAATYTATYTAAGTGPPPTSCGPAQYLAEYFANKTLTGTPASQGCEAGPLNKDWALGAPTGVGPDNFSARWTGNFDFATPGSYTFTATADDGIRVYVDGTILIDQWKDQEATFTAARTLTAGTHQVRVEFFDSYQEAVAKVGWTETPATPPPATTCPTGQYRAEYFGNTTLTGTPARTVCEAAPLNKSWGTGGPAGVPVNNFTARWTGTFTFTAGNKTFVATTDDGVRVYLDNVLIINRWTTSGTTRVTRNVTAGAHVVRVEYIERTGSATARLTW